MNNFINKFKDDMFNNGIEPPNFIIADSQIHRFHVTGDRSSTKNGWYIIFSNPIPCGAYGSWKHGVTFKYFGKHQTAMNNVEKRLCFKQINDAKNKLNAAKSEEYNKTSLLAAKYWYNSKPADIIFPYILRKQIDPFIARQFKNRLVLPIIDHFGKIWSLQYIYESGNKQFLAGGNIKGKFIPLHGNFINCDKVIIAEGFSTTATIAMLYPRAFCISALNASNLLPVAKCIKEFQPNLNIEIFSDDDRHLPENIGLIKATEAANAVGAIVYKPKWPKGSPEYLTDFNDLICWCAEHGVYI